MTKLPPLTKTHSVSLPSMWAQDFVDPRDVKMSELERVINQYQEKLSEVIYITPENQRHWQADKLYSSWPPPG